MFLIILQMLINIQSFLYKYQNPVISQILVFYELKCFTWYMKYSFYCFSNTSIRSYCNYFYLLFHFYFTRRRYPSHFYHHQEVISYYHTPHLLCTFTFRSFINRFINWYFTYFIVYLCLLFHSFHLKLCVYAIKHVTDHFGKLNPSIILSTSPSQLIHSGLT